MDNSQPIKIFTTQGKYVGSARDIIEAHKKTGADRGNISRCLNGKADQTIGFVFLFGHVNEATGRAIKAFFHKNEDTLAQFIKKHTKANKTPKSHAQKS